MDTSALAQLGTTNLFLGILAATALGEMLILGLLALWLHRRFQDINRTVEQLTTNHVAPTLERIRQVSDKAADVLASAEAVVSHVTGVANTIDERVRFAASRMGSVASTVTRAATRSGLHIRALEAGLERGLAALGRPRRSA